MTTLEYWIEALESALEEREIVLEPIDIAAIAEDIELSHEHYSMAFHVPTGNPLLAEIDALKRELEEERAKAICKECKGTGEDYCPGPYHSSTSRCPKCNGEGRHSP